MSSVLFGFIENFVVCLNVLDLYVRRKTENRTQNFLNTKTTETRNRRSCSLILYITHYKYIHIFIRVCCKNLKTKKEYIIIISSISLDQ